jgi:hypothetical protein
MRFLDSALGLRPEVHHLKYRLKSRPKKSKLFHLIKKPFCRPILALFPASQGRLIDPQLFGQLLLRQPVNPPIFPNSIS